MEENSLNNSATAVPTQPEERRPRKKRYWPLCLIAVLCAVICAAIIKFAIGGKVNVKNVNSVKLSYCVGYDLTTCRMVEKYGDQSMPSVEIDLEGDDLNAVLGMIEDISIMSEAEIQARSGGWGGLDTVAEYELKTDDGTVLTIGYDYGYVGDDDRFFDSSALYEKLREIAETYNEEHYYIDLETDYITIQDGDEQYEVTDAEKIDRILSENIFEIDYAVPDDEIKYVLDYHNGQKLELGISLGRLCTEKDTCKNVRTDDLYDVVKHKVLENDFEEEDYE